MTVVLTHATSSSEVLHLSLETAVTFFVPAKKVTRWPKDSGSSGFLGPSAAQPASKESYPLAEGQWKLFLSSVQAQRQPDSKESYPL